MNVVELTEEIVKSLVINTDAVSVKEFPTEEENVTLIQVMVDEADMGRVIGREGRTANALEYLIITRKRNVTLYERNYCTQEENAFRHPALR